MGIVDAMSNPWAPYHAIKKDLERVKCAIGQLCGVRHATVGWYVEGLEGLRDQLQLNVNKAYQDAEEAWVKFPLNGETE